MENKMWHNVVEEVPTSLGEGVIVLCKNKNKEDGIWLWDFIPCWEGKWEPRTNWEDPVKWAYLRDFLPPYSEEKPADKRPLKTAKFKVGDRIHFKEDTHVKYTIKSVRDGYYVSSTGIPMDMDYTDANFELIEKPVNVQWTGNNLKEVIEFTGKSPRFDEWFKTWDEYESYVRNHGNIFKLFNKDGSHYEVPVGAWIVKTPDGRNVPSRFIPQEKPFCQDLEDEVDRYFDDIYSEVTGCERAADSQNEEVYREIARHFAEWQKKKDEKTLHQEWMKQKENLFKDIRKAESNGYDKGKSDGIIIGKEKAEEEYEKWCPPGGAFKFNLNTALYNFGKEIASKCLGTHILDETLNEYVTEKSVNEYVERYAKSIADGVRKDMMKN